jgi:hypothetical protein
MRLKNPTVAFEVNPRFKKFDTFALEQFALQGSVGLADQELAAFADDTMPGNAFA